MLEASDADHAAFLAGTAGEPLSVAPAVDLTQRAAERAPRALVVVNAEPSGPRRLGRWLEEEGVVVDAVLGSDGLPADLDGYDGLVMLGGGLMPDDDDRAPWLAQERVLARQAIEADLPTLGICLGGQLLAHVAGGEVRASFGPKERGATLITPSPHGAEDALLSALEDAAHMIENHQDMITALPPDAVLLASSGAVENQAFRLGAHVRGLQFHPEVGAEDLERWQEPTTRAEGDRPVAELLAEARAVDEVNTRASRAMAAAFAAEVRAAAHARTAGGAAST
nr:type 1 glutamine amidotransferase [Microbacterium bovistercoris]